MIDDTIDFPKTFDTEDEAVEWLEEYLCELAELKDEEGNLYKQGTSELLTALLFSEVVWVRSGMKDEEAFEVYVNCNDLFAWACSDAEKITPEELPEFYNKWRKNKHYPDIWCCAKRRQMPQDAVVERVWRPAGLNVEAIQKEYGLRPNFYNSMAGLSHSFKKSRYETWCKETGRTAYPEGVNWWAVEWDAYLKDNPEYGPKSDEISFWKARIEWCKENGYEEEIADSEEYLIQAQEKA